MKTEINTTSENHEPIPVPRLAIPKDFTGELTITMPTGIAVKFTPKRTAKGRPEFRWSYPSMVEDTSKMDAASCITSYALMLGADRIRDIIENELDQLSQYFWRLAESDPAKFEEYIKSGKASREIVYPQRLLKQATKLHKEALEARTAGDMAKFADLIGKSKELKKKAMEILTKEEDFGE